MRQAVITGSTKGIALAPARELLAGSLRCRRCTVVQEYRWVGADADGRTVAEVEAVNAHDSGKEGTG